MVSTDGLEALVPSVNCNPLGGWPVVTSEQWPVNDTSQYRCIWCTKVFVQYGWIHVLDKIKYGCILNVIDTKQHDVHVLVIYTIQFCSDHNIIGTIQYGCDHGVIDTIQTDCNHDVHVHVINTIWLCSWCNVVSNVNGCVQKNLYNVVWNLLSDISGMLFSQNIH